MVTKIIDENTPLYGEADIESESPNCFVNQKHFIGKFEEKTDIWLYQDTGKWRVGFRHSENKDDFTSIALCEMFRPVEFLSQIPIQARYNLIQNRQKMNHIILKSISEKRLEVQIFDLVP